MSDLKSERPAGAVLYSEKLLGLRSECPVCGEREMSTGWLLEREGGDRYVELKCTGCRSRGGTWNPEWQTLIREALTGMTNACDECGGDGRCDACGGSGVELGVAVLGGSEVDCEKCGGSGACKVCGGSWEVFKDEERGEKR